MRLNRFSILLPLFAALAFIGAAPAWAGGSGTVGGRVVNAKGKPVANAHVTVQDSDGGHLQATETNAQGHFWFAFLPEGEYDVRAYYKGGISEWRHNVWVSPGKQTNVTLHLHPKKSKRSAAQ